MNLYLVTEKDLFHAAYIVARGWEYNDLEGKWFKAGHERTTFKRRICGCCTDTVKTGLHRLEDAYWAEKEHEDHVEPVDSGAEEGRQDLSKEG